LFSQELKSGSDQQVLTYGLNVNPSGILYEDEMPNLNNLAADHGVPVTFKSETEGITSSKGTS